MKIETRKDIKDFILEIENSFPVNDWNFNNTHIWPYLRINLFLNLCGDTLMKNSHDNHIKQKTVGAKQNIIVKIFSKAKKLVSYYFWLNSLKEKNTVFHAQKNFRVDFEGKKYNRFFDSLIYQKKIGNDYYFIETRNSSKDVTNSEMVIWFDEVFDLFLPHYFLKNFFFRSKIHLALNGYEDLINYLNVKGVAKRFCEKFSKNSIATWVEIDLLPRLSFYDVLLKKVKPKQVYILCYYNDFPFVLAANKLKIETIEFQHGAQTDEHLCYGNWTKVPETGYDFLPRTFWSWDVNSKNTIDKWTSINPLYNCFVGGNTWVDFWKGMSNTYTQKDFILYTLQPRHGTNILFPDKLIEFIKNQKIKWFIRLHPSQADLYKEFQDFFIQKKILELINFNEALYDPLPVLLKNCLIHVTNSSGSTIEATMFGKKTILLHEVGATYYKDLIIDGSAKYIPADNNFKDNFFAFLNE